MRIFQWLEARLGFVTSLLFAEPTLSQNIKIVDDSSAAVKLAENADNLLISIPKCLTRKQIDNSLDRIFRKELSFEKGRQTRNPPRSNRQICPKGADVRHKGVRPMSGKYRAFIYDGEDNISLGSFDTERNAAKIYDAAALVIFGASARFNFPLGILDPLHHELASLLIQRHYNKKLGRPMTDIEIIDKGLTLYSSDN